jgi:ubiquinone/menaquinone biosynthesis C-methylase UbiE
LNILDVASGTGRFLTFLRDNWPAANYTALELSPHYLEATRVNNKRFENVEGVDGQLTLVEANCEAMPFPDNSFDAVTNVYLFHEMPKEARRNAAKEFARVLKPGGKLFFVDSAQVGDGKFLGMEKAFDQALERFPQFNHEPYYRDYSLTDLRQLFGEFGLVARKNPPSRGFPSAGRSRRRKLLKKLKRRRTTVRETVEPVMVDDADEAAKAR